MALRAATKALQDAMKNKGNAFNFYIRVCLSRCLLKIERYYLIFWEEEGSVSFHKEDEVKMDGSIGDIVPVQYEKGKESDGRIAGIGKYITFNSFLLR